MIPKQANRITLPVGTRVGYAQESGKPHPGYAQGTVVLWKDHDHITMGGGKYPDNAAHPDEKVVQWDPYKPGVQTMGPMCWDSMLAVVAPAPEAQDPSTREIYPGKAPQGYMYVEGDTLLSREPRWWVRRSVARAGGEPWDWDPGKDLHMYTFGGGRVGPGTSVVAMVSRTWKPAPISVPKKVIYLAHPVSGEPEGNAFRAIAWIRWLTEADPSRIYVAPWVAEVLAFAGRAPDKAFYDRVLEDDCHVVRRLDAVLMVGGLVSEGMRREADAARLAGKKVVDWTDLAIPPKGTLGFDRFKELP